MKKLLMLLLILALAIFTFTGCDGFVPGEGEGEGEDEVKQVVLVEAFVAEGCPNCAVVKPHLDQLANEFGSKEVILVEPIPWGIYSIPNTIPNAYERYNWYSLSGGVPKILMNGTLYTGSNTYSAIKSMIQAQLSLTPRISIQASRSTSGQTSIITGTIKNIGDSNLSNLVINGMTFRSRGAFGYAVTSIFENEKISVASLSVGETKNFTMTLQGLNWDDMRYDGVIFVQLTTGNKNIYQSLFID